jgi:hypothetical protein
MLFNARRLETRRLYDINKQVSAKKQELDELRNKSLDYRKDVLVLRAYGDFLELVARLNELTEASNSRLPNWSATMAKLKPPIAITARIDRGKRMLLVPFTVDATASITDRSHFLIVSSANTGRMEFPVSKLFAGPEYRLAPGHEGVLASSMGLRIPNAETIEVFVEEKATPQSKPVRVSNIVNLTWDLPDPDGQRTTESHSTTKDQSGSGQNQSESRERRLRELKEQLKFVEEQLSSQIPDVRESLEKKILTQKRDELQSKIAELQLNAPTLQLRPESLANYPELVQMRWRLGDLNLKISQERFRQEGAKESAYLQSLKSQAQRLQSEIWELEKTLQP